MTGSATRASAGAALGGHILAFTGTDRRSATLAQALSTLAEIGYRSVELMGVAHDPAVVAASGLAVAACHGVPGDWSDVAAIVAACTVLDCRDLCSSGPLVWDQRTIADYRATARVLNDLGRSLRGAGIHLHYHNHAFEFQPVEGGTCGFEALVDDLDPDACDLCLDLGWVELGGRDPVALLAAVGDRVGYVHLRDFERERSVPLGEGSIDLAAQLPAVRALPRCRAVVVEQDRSPQPARDMATSYHHLRRLGW